MHSSSMSTGIARWQKANILVLDRIFSNPALSDDVKAVHDRAYGLSRLYVAIAYYRFGLWDEAQAMMREAFQWQPMWSAHPLEVVNALCIAAFDLRVADPVSFIEGVFAHLPAEAMSLMDHKQRACATIFIEAGLRAVAGAEHSKAIAHFATAKPLCTPSEFNKIFIQRTRELALVLPVTSPSAFVEQAFETAHENHLPASLRRQVLAEVNIASAFENYTSGHFNQVQSQVIKAIANKPNLALNRGVLKILLKSLTPLEK
jgi:hypothetical protein